MGKMPAYKPNLLVILGPTASGKTRLGVQAARELNGEIISADSRQVYRGMDIGTGKDLAEYGDIPYHLIDIFDPGREFNLFEFQKRFFETFEEIHNRGKLPIVVGGTGLYIEAALKGYRLIEVPENPKLREMLAKLGMEELKKRLLHYNPKAHNTTDLLDRQRLVRAIEIAEGAVDAEMPPLPELRPVVFGMRWERSVLRRRITVRLRQRMEQGMVEEVRRLHGEGVPYETFELYGLEYRFIAKYLRGELNKNDMFQKLNGAIHQLAKRQETWFRKMERQGTVIHWFDGTGNPLAEVMKVLQGEKT
jgi:tRNA dimethylallyltransferase